MTNDNTDPLAARLAQIRERNEAHIKAMAFTEWTVQREPCGNVRLLLAAVEAVLALAEKWETDAKSLDEMADRAAARGALPERTSLMSTRAQALEDHAKELRAPITAALPGESLPGLRETGEPGNG